jgi:nitrite reductase (NADH) large subunit
VRAVIVGNGLAGTMAAKTLRELSADAEITVFSEEDYPYYPRPNLIEYLAGHLPYEKLFAFPPAQAERLRIDVRLGERVTKVRPDARALETRSGLVVPFDAALLAGGAKPFVPQIRGAEKKGVFTLRTLRDALDMLEHLRTHRRVVVLGGGLLGLEIARALASSGADVQVIEFLDRLLPRQLDGRGAAILKGRIEKMGISVRVGTAAEEILGEGEVKGIRLGPGEEIPADTVVIAAGVKPDVTLALEAGLAVRRGIVTDDRLRSSHPSVFVAGDGVEHRGSLYGIIPASFEQSRAAAHNMLGLDKPYEGTMPAATLKVAGVYLTSVGIVNPDEDKHEVLTRHQPEEGVYKKLVIKDGLLVGAIWLGTKKGVGEISRLVSLNKNVEAFKHDLLDETVDLTGM